VEEIIFPPTCANPLGGARTGSKNGALIKGKVNSLTGQETYYDPIRVAIRGISLEGDEEEGIKPLKGAAQGDPGLKTKGRGRKSLGMETYTRKKKKRKKKRKSTVEGKKTKNVGARGALNDKERKG